MKYLNSRHAPLDQAKESAITEEENDITEELLEAGETLRQLRIAKNWSQATLESKLGLEEGVVDKMEKGDHPISRTTAEKLGSLFQVDQRLFL